MTDCKDCKFCYINEDFTAECQKNRTLKVTTEVIDCNEDGKKPNGGPFEVVRDIFPVGDDCEVGEAI
jgi:hypothetical protein